MRATPWPEAANRGRYYFALISFTERNRLFDNCICERGRSTHSVRPRGSGPSSPFGLRRTPLALARRSFSEGGGPGLGDARMHSALKTRVNAPNGPWFPLPRERTGRACHPAFRQNERRKRVTIN